MICYLLTFVNKLHIIRNAFAVRYWKPKGVTCTNNQRDPTNIIAAGRFDLFPQRIFSVGRLDKDSTGLILLTSDGRVNNAILNPRTKNEKVY
jgi:pseudouridine synthase